MPVTPLQALQAASRPIPAVPEGSALLVAGATGTLGNEVLRRLAGAQRFARTLVLAREPFTDGMRGVTMVQTGDATPDHWPLAAAQAGVIMFDPPRLFHDRERALWTPQPVDLAPVAAWMRRCGATTLAVVLPHAQGRLPEALKRGLAGLEGALVLVEVEGVGPVAVALGHGVPFAGRIGHIGIGFAGADDAIGAAVGACGVDRLVGSGAGH